MQHNIHLLQKNFTTVDVVFEDEVSIHELRNPNTVHCSHSSYTYKADLDLQLQIGDFAIVHARDELKIVRVVDVHLEPKIDPNARFTYKWVVQKVDARAYLQRLDEEAQLKQILDRLDYVEHQQQLHQRLQNASQHDAVLAELIEQLKAKD